MQRVLQSKPLKPKSPNYTQVHSHTKVEQIIGTIFVLTHFSFLSYSSLHFSLFGSTTLLFQMAKSNSKQVGQHSIIKRQESMCNDLP